jgi:hypothetical protein
VYRYFVAFCAVCLGGLIAAADLSVSMPLLPAHQRIAGKRSPEENRLILDACVIFYSVAYATGRFLYRWAGAHADAEELRSWSRWHMMLLNVFGGGWLVTSAMQALHHRVVRPAAVVGVLLVVLTAYDVWRGFRKLREERIGQA